MKLLYITTIDPKSQGDYQEVMILHGLRTILGDNCIDYPKKKVMYRDFSVSPQLELHGRGFTLYTMPIEEIDNSLRENISDIDYILYGVTNAYGITDYPELNKLTPNVWYIDGHDKSNIQKTPCFKRELFHQQEGVFPTGFGIPKNKILPFNFKNKTQLYQKTVPPYAIFNQQVLGLDARKLYIFENENDYYDDMTKSWFGLSCMKGGWDSLRHYEIMAAGSLLLFRDYDKKPQLCSPQNLPCYSYSSKEELNHFMNTLVIDGKPTDDYLEMLFKQRDWLLKYGTTEARALDILKIMIKNNKKNEIFISHI
jgi:hypothetical protein